MQRVDDVRNEFRKLLREEKFVTDKTGVKTIEIAPAAFIADEDAIFGKVNWDYVGREVQWYDSRSRRVEDIPGKVPEIWKKVASRNGEINSNYGWCVYSEENGHQYENVLGELKRNPDSRRAVMIYNRPSMHGDYCRDGMSDFMCTNAVQYLIRDNKLHALVEMRSNDAVFGFKNDRAWQKVVLWRLSMNLGYEMGDIYWWAGSLHVYERHFHLVGDHVR